MRTLAAAVLIGAVLIAGAVIWVGSNPTPVTVTVEPTMQPLPTRDPSCTYHVSATGSCIKVTEETPQW
jgi:hypothetical protein